MGATFTLDMTQLAGFAGASPVAAASSATLTAFGARYITALAERNNGRPGTIPRTGNLRRDWNTSVQMGAAESHLVIHSTGAADKYAGLQEFGGTITPKRSKYLWIPAKANLTPAGVARLTPTQARAQGGLFAKGAFFGRPQVKSDAKGYGPHAVPLFWLRKSVTVPARLGANALFKQMAPEIGKSIVERVKESLNG